MRNTTVSLGTELYPEDVIPGPVWKDHCEHGNDCYVGSLEINNKVDGKIHTVQYDIYVFHQHGHEGDKTCQSVCMRYGNKGEEYISAGTVLDLLLYSDSPTRVSVFRKAFLLISQKGNIRWDRKE